MRPDCYKTRGCFEEATKRFGDIEPLAYLHAWIPLQAMQRKGSQRATHRQADPSDAEVAAYAEKHRAELQAIVDRYVL